MSDRERDESVSPGSKTKEDEEGFETLKVGGDTQRLNTAGMPIHDGKTYVGVADGQPVEGEKKK